MNAACKLHVVQRELQFRTRKEHGIQALYPDTAASERGMDLRSVELWFIVCWGLHLAENRGFILHVAESANAQGQENCTGCSRFHLFAGEPAESTALNSTRMVGGRYGSVRLDSTVSMFSMAWSASGSIHLTRHSGEFFAGASLRGVSCVIFPSLL